MISVPWKLIGLIIGRTENFPLEPGSHFPSMTSNPIIQHHEGDLTQRTMISIQHSSKHSLFLLGMEFVFFAGEKKTHVFCYLSLGGGGKVGGAGSHFMRK